jgi:tripartite ATP-independent transporter DctM subunit
MLSLCGIFATLIIFLFAGLPIAVGLGIAGIVWIVAKDPMLLRGSAYALWNNADSVTLVAVPMFLLMGEIVQRSQVAVRFYRALSIWVRWLPGGLLHSNIGASAIFAAVSGSSVATAATIGTTAIPDLLRLGYPRSLIAGTLTAGGTLGIIIPPSIAMIIYGAITETSVGALFLAGVIPGIIITVFFIIYVVAVSLLRGRGVGAEPAPRITMAERLRSLLDILPVAALILLIVVGIYRGWATPTEVASLGVAGACLIALGFGKINLKVFAKAMSSTVRFTAMLVFVILSAHIFAFALFSWGSTRAVISLINDLGLPPGGVLFAVVVLCLFLGMFIDALSMMVMILGVVFPIITSLGYDPVWFGIILVLLLEIGLITPPVGLNLYTVRGIMPGATIGEVSRASFPFVLLLLLGIVLFTFFPEIVLWLPQHAR